MAFRQIGVTDEVVRFGMLFETSLTTIGFSIGHVDVLAAELVEVLRRIANGNLKNGAKYLGVDTKRPAHSVYSFCEPAFVGMFSSTSNAVVITGLRLNMENDALWDLIFLKAA